MTGERVGAALLGATAVFWLAFIWGWEPAYLTLTVDDAFYYLVIAKRVAHGEGITFDGIAPTNGFHPLWLVVLAALAKIGPSDTASLMRCVLSVQVLLVVVGTMLVARTRGASNAKYAIVFALAWLNFYVAKVVLNGQESALQYMLLCATLVAYWRRSSGYVVGLLAGLLALARLDSIVFGAALCLLPIVWPELSDKAQDARLSARIGLGARIFLPFAVIILLYAAFNQIEFGHVVPIHIALKSEAPGPPTALAVVGALLIASFILGYALRARRSGRAALRNLFPIVVYAGAVLAYVWIRHRFIPEIWHFVPFLTLGLLVGAQVLANIREKRRTAVSLVAVVSLAFVVLAFLSWSHRLSPRSYSAYRAARRAGLWLERNTPRNAVVAGWDCGIAAAHSKRRVVQLEGLVNDWRFKTDFLDRNRVDSYLDERHVEYIVQPFDARVLRRGEIYMTGGVSLGSWHVRHAECVTLTPGWPRAGSSQRVYVVLARDALGPRLDSVGATACAPPLTAR